jgi:hypothetical protein
MINDKDKKIIIEELNRCEQSVKHIRKAIGRLDNISENLRNAEIDILTVIDKIEKMR